MPRRKSTPERREQNDFERDRRKRRKDVKLDRQIAILQNIDIPLIPKLPFSRLVREIMMQYKDNFRITAVALVLRNENNLKFELLKNIIFLGSTSRSL